MSNYYRLLLLGCMLSTIPFAAVAQTGIGTTTPDASTRLDIVASNRGVRLPQVSLASVTDGSTIALPATSLLVWNTNASLPNGKGYYYNSGTPASPNWVKLVDTSSGVLTADNGLNKSGSTVKLGGNLTAATTVTNNGNDLSLAGSGTTTTFTSAGLVGIGTSSPAQRLHVAGTGGTPNVRLGSLSGTGVRFVTADANGDLSTNKTGADNGLFWGILGNSGTTPATNFVGTTDAQALAIRTNNTEWMRLSSAGNIGVGTTSPAFKLHFVNDGGGGGAVDDFIFDEYGTVGDQQIRMRRSGGTVAAPTDLPSNTYIGGIGFSARVNGVLNHNGAGMLGYYKGNSKTNASELRFYTSGLSTDRVDATTYVRMTLDSAGRLGLGTLTPVQRLHVAGTGGTANVRFGSLSGTGVRLVTADANGDLNTVTTGTGIGISGSTISNTGVVTADNGLTVTSNKVQLGGNLVQATTVTNNGFALGVAGSGVTTTFTSSGDVGINTTTPQGRLEVVGASVGDPGSGDDIDVTSISDAVGAMPAFITRHARGSTVAAPANLQAGDNLGAFHLFGRVNGSWQIPASISSTYKGDGTTNLANLRFITSSAERMRITETGAIGVNVAVPDASAIVDVTSSNKGVLLPRIALVSLTDVATITSPATGLLVFNTTTNLTANLTPGFYYWSGTSWAQLQDTNSAGGSKTKSYAFVGLYSDQYTNGIDCGEFSFRLRRRTDATNYTVMSENVDAQAKWNGASGSLTALSYAETLYGGAQYDFSANSAFAPTANPQTGTRSNNVLNAGTWYSWGEPGFAVSAANQEKRQYILTPAGSSSTEKYFYRIEFAFLVGNFTACPTCNSITNSQEIVNGAKVLILVEKVYN